MEPTSPGTDRMSPGAAVSHLASSHGRAGIDIPVPRPEPAGEAVVPASPAGRASHLRLSRIAVLAAWTVALALPVVGLVSLFARARLDPQWTGSRLHFVLFLAVGSGAFILAYIAGRAADRRGDARVFLLSLAFLVTGGFLAIHAIGTPGVLLDDDLPGFTVAIPVGLLIAAVFAAASAWADLRPGLAVGVMRHRAGLRAAVLVTMAAWVIWTVAELPPLAGASGEGAGTVLRILAALGAAAYGASAARYVAVYRRRMTLLPWSVVTCFILLAEALSGSALVRELGGPGYVAYAVVGDTINTASRLQAQAPLGGVLIGAETYRRLPPHAEAEARPGLRVKGKQVPVDAYVLRSVPDERPHDGRHRAWPVKPSAP